jgi:hypothetical protein
MMLPADFYTIRMPLANSKQPTEPINIRQTFIAAEQFIIRLI